MIQVNDNFRLLPASYLFSEVGKRISDFRKSNAGMEIIRMDIGDITQPMFPVVIEAMHKAVNDLANAATFHGYGPEQGYPFLREAIQEFDYASKGMNHINISDIFISDGAKSDLGNLGDIYSRNCKVAVMNPAYPVYVDDSVIDGRAGKYEAGKWDNIIYLDCKPENNFLPSLPEKRPDVIFLCFPNNPTGEGIPLDELAKWVGYARENGSVIIYDSAYESFVREKDVARSIYEIAGAEEVAIEVRSFSKTAGFTGLRCGYTVVPEKLIGRFADGSEVSLNRLWTRRQTTKFNGASYVSQRAASAVYSPEGQSDVKRATDYYVGNARIIRDTFRKLGYKAYGGVNSPYVWASMENGKNSWDTFGRLLTECGFSTTPGSGFGSGGEGYVRLTGFNSREKTEEAMSRLENKSI